MARSNDPLADLRLADVTTFLTVVRAGSISGAARELKVTPSQVSKAMGRLESQFHTTLLSRGGRGVGVSEEGMRIAPELTEVVARLSAIGARERELPELTFAAASFMVSRFLPPLAAALPGLRFRAVDLPPALVRSRASDGYFDMVFTLGPARLPSLWSESHIGEVRKALFASPALAKKLAENGPVLPAAIRAVPFISPLYSVDRTFIAADDECPLPRAQRNVGHEVQTIAVALELAARTEHVVFGPVLSATELVKKGELVEVPVVGWDVREPLYVSCNVDRVRSSAQKVIIETIRAELQRT